MKTILQAILRVFAKAILKKYRPEVIGVTGSVGKSSTKEAIYSALHKSFVVYRSQKSYNNELGLPLTIIGSDTQGRSLFGWLGVIGKAMGLLLMRRTDYPKVLILEMGADHPGNIAHLLSIAPCRIGVVTAVGPTHLEQLGSVENVLKEKMSLVESLKGGDTWAILNADDGSIMKASKTLKGNVLTFGMAENADVRLVSWRQHAQFFPADNNVNCGLTLEIAYRDQRQEFFFAKLIGIHQAYSVLAGLCVGITHGLSLDQMASSFEGYTTPSGRMKLIDGVKKTLLIDDTYNASPKAVKAALDTLASFEISGDSKRIAVLGRMAELGKESAGLHREVGEYAGGRVDMLLTVEDSACTIANAAVAGGLDKSKILCFTTTQDAGLKLQELMKQGDVVLIKGSQSSRMERVVREVMAEPERASELLVRQAGEWMGK